MENCGLGIKAQSPKPCRMKLREHREHLRSRGLRPIPDLGAGYACTSEVHRPGRLSIIPPPRANAA